MSVNQIASSATSVQDVHDGWGRLDNQSGTMTKGERETTYTQGGTYTYTLSERTLHPNTTDTTKNCYSMYVVNKGGDTFEPTNIIKGDSPYYIPAKVKASLGGASAAAKYTLIEINKTDYDAEDQSAQGSGFGDCRLRFAYTG